MHLAAAGALGILGAVIGVPVAIAGLFGGVLTFLQPGVPLELLDQALTHARPMTGAEYDDWLDEILTPAAGY